MSNLAVPEGSAPAAKREYSVSQDLDVAETSVGPRGSATRKDVLPDDAIPGDSALDFSESEDDKNLQKHDDHTAPMIWFFLSFIFPPLGWVGFLQARHSPKETPRGRWAHRACASGSLLCFIYTFVAASLVGHFGQLADTNAKAAGCGFGGPCPLFGPGGISLD